MQMQKHCRMAENAFFGTGRAICDGKEEELKPGVMHICPKESEHSIVNTGEEDLVMLTIVVKK